MMSSTHHVGIIRVEAHLLKRVEPRHEPKAHRPIELRKRIVRILTRLHRRELLWCTSLR